MMFMLPLNKKMKAVELLENSQLFHFSLGSKELFHSNFLAWFAQKYPAQFVSVFAPNMPAGTTLRDGKPRVTREQKNIDLHAYLDNGKELIIENKVKSLPYMEQLEAYSEDVDINKTNFLLLSLAGHLSQTKEIECKKSRATWQIMTYDALGAALGEIIEQIDDQYDNLILQDYISFVGALSELCGDVKLIDEHPFDFYDDSKDSVLYELRKLRIADLYLKLKYQSLAECIRKKLLDSSYVDKDKVHFDGTASNKLENGGIYLSSGMLHAHGYVDVVVCVDKQLKLIIQIQHNNYRHLVRGYMGVKKTKEYSRALKENGYWFNFADELAKEGELPNKPEKLFNTFGKTDFYRSVKLSTSGSGLVS
ncbi:MAG: PD-(D/E)XK nuclease family protein [Patescibacteria group bacterium]